MNPATDVGVILYQSASDGELMSPARVKVFALASWTDRSVWAWAMLPCAPQASRFVTASEAPEVSLNVNRSLLAVGGSAAAKVHSGCS